MTNTDTNQGILDELVSEQLSAVIFIQDYLQLEFDGKRLTINVWPTVFVSENEFQIDHIGYRDALCKLIGKQVTSTSETETEIVVGFDTGRIAIGLTDDTAIERLIFENEVT